MSRLIIVTMRNYSDKRCRENQNTNFTPFSRKSRLLLENVEKYSTVSQATDGNMAYGALHAG
jgi:hypothetical protein